ncbi:unnamed protein product [Amoebophrya sp. A25]|nr:unnamed protein product [Amoebophrya sp. A25]|eukprot:GSA25T00018998001.1
MSSGGQPNAYSLEFQKDAKRHQLDVLPVAVTLTTLVSGSIIGLGIWTYGKSYYYESVVLGFLWIVFNTYHIHKANDRVEADYYSSYAGGTHLSMDVAAWYKVESMLTVYALLLLIIHGMCNEWAFNDELLQGWYFLILLYLFEIEQDQFTNTIFVPIILALVLFILKLLFRCPDDAPTDAIKKKELLCTFGLWLLMVIVYAVLSYTGAAGSDASRSRDSQSDGGTAMPSGNYSENRSSIVEPGTHFLVGLMVLASYMTLRVIERAKRVVWKKNVLKMKAAVRERQRSRQRDLEAAESAAAAAAGSEAQPQSAEDQDVLEDEVEDDTDDGAPEPWVQQKLNNWMASESNSIPRSTPIGMQRIAPGLEVEDFPPENDAGAPSAAVRNPPGTSTEAITDNVAALLVAPRETPPLPAGSGSTELLDVDSSSNSEGESLSASSSCVDTSAGAGATEAADQGITKQPEEQGIPGKVLESQSSIPTVIEPPPTGVDTRLTREGRAVLAAFERAANVPAEDSMLANARPDSDVPADSSIVGASQLPEEETNS